jgi:hypothetical protein
MYISNIKPQYCATMVHEMHIQRTEYGQVWWVSLLFVSCELTFWHRSFTFNSNKSPT